MCGCKELAEKRLAGSDVDWTDEEAKEFACSADKRTVPQAQAAGRQESALDLAAPARRVRNGSGRGEALPERIDAHHHLWRFRAAEYDWLTEPEYTALRRDFLLPELRAATAEAAIDGAIAVQARQTIEETRWLLELAAATAADGTRPLLRGVVGWAPVADAEFPQVLEELRTSSLLRGLRHVVQGEPAGFLEGAAFHRGVAALEGSGLVYDVLVMGGVRPWQMTEAIAFVDRHPRQSFVLDHAGKPRIADLVMEPWATQLRELARRENVTCKVSGMVTEARWSEWTAESLRPYLDTVVEAFGPERLMAGSDWPVCLVASGYGAWWRVLEEYFAPFSESERAAVFGGTATRVYGL